MRAWPLIAVGLGAWWLWPASHERAVGTQRAAILPDGFAVLDGAERKRVHVFDGGGERVRTVTIAGLPVDTRLVGTRGGPALVWQDGRRVAFAAVDALDRPQRFGKHAHHLCAQTATNAKRFAVAWTEQDGALWFLHGPVASQAAEAGEPAKQPDWCGIASADDKVALAWRTGGRTLITRCSKDACPSQVKLAVDANPVLGFGCTREACVFATREGRTTYATWVSAQTGKAAWRKPLPDAGADTAVSIVGIGARIAIAYSLGPEPVVRVADKAGELRAVWQDGADADTVPSLAWTDDYLVIAFERDGESRAHLLGIREWCDPRDRAESTCPGARTVVE